MRQLAALSLIPLAGPAWSTDAMPSAEVLEREQAVIGEVAVSSRNIFDLSDPEENKRLYRWANKLHIVTRDDIIGKQLLFRPGDTYSERLIRESERILRSRRYLYDAWIRPTKYENGVVDLEVSTQDVWSLQPHISVSRSGGETNTSYGIEETNLLGRGQLLRFRRVDNVDRTSNRFEFEDPHLGNRWIRLRLRIADNSDGHSNQFSLMRPFYALDARWAAGLQLVDDDRRTALYRLGDEAAEFRHQRHLVSVSGGWSLGLHKGWARRWTIGAIYDDNFFSPVTQPVLPAAIPSSRKLVYPFVGFEILEDEFEAASNVNQIGRTEDFYIGRRVAGSLGWASKGLGSDRDALIYAVTAEAGLGSVARTALLLTASANGRIEGGDTRNSVFSMNARFFHRQSEKRLFAMSLDGSAGHALDLDNPIQLGGDSGLRGYPLRYQSGDSRMLFTIEQRYFTDWYPFHLFRVGGAVFADVGRTWGSNSIGEENYGWLRDVGFGLRLAPSKIGADEVAHLDFAFPLDGDPSIDSLQISIEAKKSF